MVTMKVDSIIIGARVIGAACAYELAKGGRKTLNIDMLPAAGYGSTSNSCAIIRVNYSATDSTALAYKAFHYWQEWPHTSAPMTGKISQSFMTPAH